MTDTLSQPASGGIVRQALAFIKSPHAMRPAKERLGAQVAPLFKLMLLNVTVLFALLPLLMLWAKSQQITPPDFSHIPRAFMVVATLVAAPLLEELAFRGWLAGRPWQLLLLGTVLIAATALAAIGPAEGSMVPLAIVALGIAVVVAGSWSLRRKQNPPKWFVRQFRWIFWTASALFAVAHISNYLMGPNAPAFSWHYLPLAIPQLWSGLLFGFTRLRFGLSRSMALHFASNGLVLAVSSLSGLPGA